MGRSRGIATIKHRIRPLKPKCKRPTKREHTTIGPAQRVAPSSPGQAITMLDRKMQSTSLFLLLKQNTVNLYSYFSRRLS